MLLYTHHPKDFDIVKTFVKRDMSPYISDDFFGFRECYEWLFNFLGIDTEEVIWCNDNKEIFSWGHGEETVLWTLDIPKEIPIYKFNKNVWDIILLGCHYIPDSEFDRIGEDDDGETDKIIIDWENKYLMEETWKRYLLDLKPNDPAEYIIPQPIKKEWIVEKQWFSGYDPDLIKEGAYACAFQNKATKEKVIEAIRSLIKCFENDPEYNEVLEDDMCFFSWPRAKADS